MVEQQAFLGAPLARHVITDTVEEGRARQRVGHRQAEVVERQRGGEAQRVEHGVVGLAGVADDEERADLEAGVVGGLDGRCRLRGRDLLVHQLENAVVARLDAEEDAKAAGLSHGPCRRLVEGVDAAQTLPVEAQPAAPDLVADLEHSPGVQGEHVVAKRDAVVPQGEGLLDLVDYVDRRALAVGVAEDDVAAELAGERAPAGAHDRRDREAVLAPAELDVLPVRQQLAGRKGEAVELGLERPRRGVNRGLLVSGRRGAPADDARHAVELSARLEGGEQLDHRLLAFTTHDGVEMRKEGARLAGRQRTAGHE